MDSIESILVQANSIINKSRRFLSFIDLLQVFLCGILGVNFWSLLEPERTSHHWIFGVGISFLVFLLQRGRKKNFQITRNQLALALDIEYGTLNTPGNNSKTSANKAISGAREHIEKLRRLEKIAMRRHTTTLVLPLILVIVTIPQAMGSFRGAISAVSEVAKRFNRGATLTIVHGAFDPNQNQKSYGLLSKEPQRFQLLAQNLIKVDVEGLSLGDQPLAVELRKIQVDGDTARETGHVFQNFQMFPERSLRDGSDSNRHNISFSVSENLGLFIPALSSKKPLAFFDVKQLPVPVVSLELDAKPQDPWPDDQTLPLKINVKATFPIQLVRLQIKSGQQTSPVLVANVVREDKLELDLDHKLLLESYVESDFAQVEIIAEALDHAVPSPLIGRSNPLVINTASAYGRYRETLGVIRSIKSIIDDALEKDKVQLDPEIENLASKMVEKSDRSPFFDGLDRMQIGRFLSSIDEFQTTKKIPILHDLSQKVNDFLFEHEIIDDRERDRDFFVAARSLSRLVEQPIKKRMVSLSVVEERLLKFLNERLVRWQMRVDRLPPNLIPSQFHEVTDEKKFDKAVRESVELDTKAQESQEIKAKQLTILSKAVVDYRKWIQDLELAEDKARSDQEKERQEGLANARNVLRELQKRQGEVSSELDRASERSQDELNQTWIGSRLKQNTNIKETKRVESQLRSLSPTAGARIQYAIDAMEQTNQTGDRGNFIDAESQSDLAGRLLRQADAAAQESQQKRRSRGGRRRVTGDNYYGQSVVGGDIEIRREYQVDRKYREDILDEVEQTQVNEEDRILLENYLRSIVR
jgi:hypothetical protein